MKYITIFVMVYLLSSPVFGHHSDAALDMESVVTFNDMGTEYSLRNPHAYFTVKTTDAKARRLSGQCK